MESTNSTTVEKEEIRVNLRGRERAVSKIVPTYPISAERECKRVARNYFKILDRYMKEYLPPLLKAYKCDVRTDAKSDDITAFRIRTEKSISKMTSELEKALKHFGMTDQLEKVSKITQTHSVKEWRKTVKAAVGIDISETYYKGGIFEQVRKAWVDSIAQLASDLIKETVQDMSSQIITGYQTGVPYETILEELQKTFNNSRGIIESLAADQVSSLNSELVERQQRDAGVKNYIWKSMGDDRVRQSHRAFDGKMFSWDAPPDGWYVTKSRGLVLTGRRCHPGQDYNCRCRALPVFDIQSVTLPVERTVELERPRTAESLYPLRRRKGRVYVPASEQKMR